VTDDLDEDRMVAAVAMIGRTGATAFTFGYQDEQTEVIAEADWYAQAYYKGTRVITEHHPDPVTAAEDLLRRLLEGGVCTHCGGLVALSERGATIHPGTRLLDGSVMTEERARSMHQCHYRRVGKTWVRGCEDAHPHPTSDERYADQAGQATRRERRAAARADAKRRRHRGA
jgi:hypothetical protein